MACFLVACAEAAIVTVAAKKLEKKEQVRNESGAQSMHPIPFSGKLKWLRNLLWGGSALLALEHFWHGELVTWFPFLSAASNPADVTGMLWEMATVGVAMAGVVTAVWAGMLLVASGMERRMQQADSRRATPLENQR